MHFSLSAWLRQKSEVAITQIPVVYEFMDVFGNISGIPSKYEIDFSIELMPGTIPISKTSKGLNYYEIYAIILIILPLE